jgi:hypothetical protein
MLTPFRYATLEAEPPGPHTGENPRDEVRNAMLWQKDIKEDLCEGAPPGHANLPIGLRQTPKITRYPIFLRI